MGKFIDLTGSVFGRLSVLHRGPNNGRHPSWVCACECGAVTNPILSHNLKSGATTSCGCARVGAVRNSRTKHGDASFGQNSSPEYVSWAQMWARCTNENLRHWKDYGGRGITVCDRWKDFGAFLEDMGRKPSPNHSIDRVENELGYSPGNCRWATTKQQSRNRRSNLVLEFHGRSQCLVDWCEEFNLDYLAVHKRLSGYGWSVERSLSTPTKKPFTPQRSSGG